MPEIVPELRNEIREVLAESNGIFTGPALQKMKKMDSFLRETSRFDPPSFCKILLSSLTCLPSQTPLASLSNPPLLPRSRLPCLPSPVPLP